MSWANVLTAMLPENLLLLGIVLLICTELVGKPRGALPLSFFVLVAAALAAAGLGLSGYVGEPFPEHLSVGPQSLLAKAIIIGLTIPVVLMSRDDFADARFHLLLVSSLYGACLMVSADSFLTLFLGVEIMSLPVYALVLLAYRRPESAEAALKYLVLSGTASATFLMGVSLLYGATGSMSVGAFAGALGFRDPLALAAVVMILAAFFLKAAVVPFHTWAPDAYEGASVPVTAYMATIVKAGVLLAVARLFSEALLSPAMVHMVAILPLVSIVWGNLTAMRQSSFRRMIAYSSIAHAGYLFYAFLGDGPGRFQAVTFYILAYGLMNVLAFAAIPPDSSDTRRDSLDHLKGLFQREPYAAIMIGLAMLSLAGIPPFPGFVAKFLIFRNVMEAGFTLYAVLGLVGSYLGIYFYLRVIQYMFMNATPADVPSGQPRRLAIAASLVCLVPAIALAVFPSWLLDRF